MKKVLILFMFIIVMSSCQYKIISPYNSGNDISFEEGSLYVIDANATEDDIKNALSNNKELTGKNIIIVAGYISSSKIFDTMKTALQNEKNVVLDLSNASFDNSYNFTLENAVFLKTVLFAPTGQITADFFKGCTSLVNIQIASSITKIDASSFSGCTSLKNIEYLGTSADILSGVKPFSGTVKPTDLYLPNISSQSEDWKDFLGVSWANIHYGVSMPK